MNTPTHVISGIWLAQFLSNHVPASFPIRKLLLAVTCLVAGAFLHLVLDVMPHYNWIVYLHGYENLPHHWLFCEAIVALIVFIPAIYFTRRIWPIALIGAFGALYPDIEKVASCDFNMPERFVIFRHHSLHLSSNDYGIRHDALITGELALIGIFFFAAWRASANARVAPVS